MRVLLTSISSMLIAAVLLSGSALLVGCNTVKGAGQDVKNAGQGVKDAADDASKWQIKRSASADAASRETVH